MKTMELVRCTRCGKAQPPDNFYPSTQKVNGLQSHCKSCNKEIVRRGRAEGRYAERERRQKEAYRAAERALRERHLAEFDDLYDTELIKRGLS